jgi:7-carboxy-7-deazaguanine synthase
MTYRVKEIYYTLQGEGAQAGRPAVFCRFSGCNLWSGLAGDRASAKCPFCDTDFVGTDGPGGGVFQSAEELAQSIVNAWPRGRKPCPCVVFTGGEPTLQLDGQVVALVKAEGFDTAIETNGTIAVPSGIDWITVSPKPQSTVVQTKGNELKLIFPIGLDPKAFEHLEFNLFYLSPLAAEDKEETDRNTRLTLEYCKNNPRWRFTMQYHRLWGLP